MKNHFKKILITAPSNTEIRPLMHLEKDMGDVGILSNKNTKIYLHVSGIGTPRTMFSLMSLLEKNSYDLLLQIGLAGSFNSSFPKGSLSIVKTDFFADILINDNEKMKSLSEMGFDDYDTRPFKNGVMEIQPPDIFSKPLPLSHSITVNTTGGSDALAKEREKMFTPDLETMEGAAFYYIAMMKGIPSIQLRAVSNFVGKRDTTEWDIPLALKNLHSFLKDELLS